MLRWNAVDGLKQRKQSGVTIYHGYNGDDLRISPRRLQCELEMRWGAKFWTSWRPNFEVQNVPEGLAQTGLKAVVQAVTDELDVSSSILKLVCWREFEDCYWIWTKERSRANRASAGPWTIRRAGESRGSPAPGWRLANQIWWRFVRICMAQLRAL